MKARQNGASQRPRKAGARTQRSTTRSGPSSWQLRLYIAGHTARATAAIENLQSICERRLQGRYQLEVVDLLKNPQLARGDQILAIPTLVRKLPAPMKKIIGDLSDEERVLVGLDLRPT